MNQSELIATVASISGESRKAVEAVLKTTADVIGSTLQAGGEVTLPGIGKLRAKDKPARTGKNPKTGVPAFSASKPLKDTVNA